MQLDYRDSRPIYCQIMDDIRAQVSSGILQEGDRLPSVRELAASLAINPNTIQRAYRELETAGWIATVPGKGCFVCYCPPGNQSPYAQFDRIVADLIRKGISPEELIARIRQGGNRHA